MVEVHCIVSGRVQGVAYRSFAKGMATELGLKGFVANLPDGSVEVLAQGDHAVLDVFVSHLRTGPAGSRVTSIYDDWHQAENEFTDFKAL